MSPTITRKEIESDQVLRLKLSKYICTQVHKYHGMFKDYGRQSCNNGNGIIITPALQLYKNKISVHLKLGSYIYVRITIGSDIIGTCQVHVVTYCSLGKIHCRIFSCENCLW